MPDFAGRIVVRPNDPMILAAIEREQLRATTLTYGDGQGRPDIPNFITKSDPYFYLHIFPCRPLSPGAFWRAGHLTPRLFLRAATRSYEDANGDRGIEIIARCNKPKMTELYKNNLPWLQLFMDGFRVPSSTAPWIGDPNTNQDYALREVFFHKGSDASAERAKRQFDTSTKKIAEYEQEILTRFNEGKPLNVYQWGLDQQRLFQAEARDRLALEKLQSAIERQTNGW